MGTEWPGDSGADDSGQTTSESAVSLNSREGGQHLCVSGFRPV